MRLEAHLCIEHGDPTCEPIPPTPSLAGTAGIAQGGQQGELGPGAPHHILAWESMNRCHHCHLSPHPVSRRSRCLLPLPAGGCCCPSPAISACCKITRVRQTPRDLCPEEWMGPAAGVRQVPSSLIWVPGVSPAMGEDGPGDAEGCPMPSRVRRGQTARGWQGFGQGHGAHGTWGQVMPSLAAAR